MRKVFPLAVAFFLLMGAWGCGPPEEEEVPEEEPVEEEVVEEEEEPVEEEEEDPAVSVDDWQNPTEVSDVVDNFKELEWNYASIRDGVETDSTRVIYRFEGSETVEGVEADLLYFAVDDEELNIWVDENGQTVQAEYEGQILPGAMVDQALEGAIQGIFWPFWTFEDYGVHQALVESTPGVEYSVISTGTEQVGEMSAEVTRMEVDVSPPVVSEGQEGTAQWAVGDFGDFQMLIEWDWVEAIGEDDMAVTFSLSNVVPR